MEGTLTLNRVYLHDCVFHPLQSEDMSIRDAAAGFIADLIGNIKSQGLYSYKSSCVKLAHPGSPLSKLLGCKLQKGDLRPLVDVRVSINFVQYGVITVGLLKYDIEYIHHSSFQFLWLVKRLTFYKFVLQQFSRSDIHACRVVCLFSCATKKGIAPPLPE